MGSRHFLVLFIFLFLYTALFFNNCMAGHKNKNTGNSTLDCSMTQMRSTYENGYWAYFKQNNCNGCHSSNGINGIPHFADKDLRTAILAFIPLGPRKISAKLEVGHQVYNFKNMKPELDPLKIDWERKTDLFGCEDSQITSSQSITFFEEPLAPGQQGRVMASMRSPQVITWNLSQRLAGLEVSASILANTDSLGKPTGYLVDDLKVKSTLSNVKIGKITVLLNENDYFNTTFKSLEQVVTKSDTFVPLGTDGASAFFEKSSADLYLNSDQWRLKIETLKLSF